MPAKNRSLSRYDGLRLRVGPLRLAGDDTLAPNNCLQMQLLTPNCYLHQHMGYALKVGTDRMWLQPIGSYTGTQSLPYSGTSPALALIQLWLSAPYVRWASVHQRKIIVAVGHDDSHGPCGREHFSLPAVQTRVINDVHAVLMRVPLIRATPVAAIKSAEPLPTKPATSAIKSRPKFEILRHHTLSKRAAIRS